jgi:hypothetical protein
VGVGDPVASSIVARLNQPGGSITGFAVYEASLAGKWLELLSEITPGLKRAAIMFNPDFNPVSLYMPSFETAARSFKVVPIIAPVHSDVEIETAIVALGREPGGGLVSLAGGFLFTHRAQIISAAVRNNVPAIYNVSDFVRDGGLLSYGVDFVDTWRRAATYVDRILRGEKPGDLPVQFPTKFEMVVNGLELTDFSIIQAAAQVWLDTIANVRIHGETQQRPIDLLVQECPPLGALNPHPYDLAHTSTSIASSQFRITLDSNQYSVPSAYAHRRLTVKAWPDRVCIYFDNQLIARHQRRYGRHEDIEDPDHAKGLIAQRSRAREQRLMMHFLALSPDATAYYDGLEQRRLNARHHVRKILALAEIYPADAVARAISDGLDPE